MDGRERGSQFVSAFSKQSFARAGVAELSLSPLSWPIAMKKIN
jgi:hypothetical protein